MLLWFGHNKMIMRMGVLTALPCLLRCATVLLNIMSLQNVGERLTQQHIKSSQKTGIFTINIFEDYLLSVNWLTFGRLFTWTQVWHTIPTAMSVQPSGSHPKKGESTRWKTGGSHSLNRHWPFGPLNSVTLANVVDRYHTHSQHRINSKKLKIYIYIYIYIYIITEKCITTTNSTQTVVQNYQQDICFRP